MSPFEDRQDDYSPKELMVGSGINTALYNQWLYRGIFTATHEAEGSGTVSSYSFADILTVALIVQLRKAGIRLKKASKIAHKVVAVIQQGAGGLNDDTEAYVSFGDGFKVSLKDTGITMVLRLGIYTIVNNICRRIQDA